MYKIKTYNFAKGDFDKWKIDNDYPAIYILENGKISYIGETGDIIRRAKQHSKDCVMEKYKFKNMHVITGEKSHKSSASHFETLLIRLMIADEKFAVIRDSDKYRKHHYSEKNIFELHFDKLWTLLEKKDLANTKNFHLIMNSSIYKYCPHTILTDEQNDALTHINNVLVTGETLPHERKFKSRPILINGAAGTGKTVVATSLFYDIKTNEKHKDKSCALVIANPSTREEIGNVFKVTNGLRKKDVVSPAHITRQFYDIIICDETHKLRRNQNLVTYKKAFEAGNKRLNLDNTHDELDWILEQSKYQILFYDKKQTVSPTDIRHDYVEKRLFERYRGIRPVELKNQMRVKAGDTYVSYIYDVLYQKTGEKKTFANYNFKLFSDFSDFVNTVFEKDDRVGLSRLCTGYPWKYVSEDNPELFDITIDEIGLKWNSDTKGWLSNEKLKREVGSIYTLHGLELNYAGVIIGPDLYFDKSDNKIKVDKSNYFDNIVKKGTPYEELEEYVLNTYAVLLTRGIEGTYVYVCDDNSREYLESYIDNLKKKRM